MNRLVVGDKFPDFTVNTHLEKGTSISKIVDGKPTVLYVIRYIGCTVCRYDIHQIEANIEAFKNKGVNIAVIMQSKPEQVNHDLKMSNTTLSYPIICDEGQAIYQTLSILPANSMDELLNCDKEKFEAKKKAAKDLGFTHGEYEGNEQQLPAFFYLDSDLTCKIVRYGKNIIDNPTISEVLEMI